MMMMRRVVPHLLAGREWLAMPGSRTAVAAFCWPDGSGETQHAQQASRFPHRNGAAARALCECVETQYALALAVTVTVPAAVVSGAGARAAPRLPAGFAAAHWATLVVGSTVVQSRCLLMWLELPLQQHWLVAVLESQWGLQLQAPLLHLGEVRVVVDCEQFGGRCCCCCCGWLLLWIALPTAACRL